MSGMLLKIGPLEIFTCFDPHTKGKYYLDRDRKRGDTYIHISKLYIVISYAPYSTYDYCKRNTSDAVSLNGRSAREITEPG